MTRSTTPVHLPKYQSMNQVVLTDADMARIDRLRDDDLARLYHHLTKRLRAAKQLEQPNGNVVTCRLSPEVVDRIKQLALRHGTTRSQVVRDMLIDYVRRHPM